MKHATLKYPAADLDESLYEVDRMLDTHALRRTAASKIFNNDTELLKASCSKYEEQFGGNDDEI